MSRETTENFFAPKLLHWYSRYGRDLPWRQTKNPYFIWLSEVILQQTRVVQGLPYYLKFIEAFPTVADLANANEREVLRLWQGLGYYSRARNLHRTAQIVLSEYGGNFPSTYTELLKLKGIGPYTAAAIASFAFREPVAVVDGNVYRVLARIFGIETDIASHAAKAEFTTLANSLIDRDTPDLYNHAIMDFGATQCVPVSPQCMFCTFNTVCVANNTGQQNRLPVKSKKAKVKNRYFNYLVCTYQGKMALKERSAKDVWSGLFDFFLIEDEKILDWELITENPKLQVALPGIVLEEESSVTTHVLSHQRIEAKFWRIELASEEQLPEGLTLYTPAEIEELPKSVLVTNYLRQLSNY